MTKNICKHCRFYEPEFGVKDCGNGGEEYDTGAGYCNRYPRARPKEEEQWCGEFKKKVKP